MKRRPDEARRGLRWPALALFAIATHGMSAAVEGLAIDITRTSLEELYDLDISTLSRQQESFHRSAAAVFVITQEDLRRAEVTTVPDALRLVPGVHAARIDASKWAVSIRGFGGRSTNKLLVMVDGRSIYNPLFAGVLWEARDVAIEDVDRIEIVRGPGSALWGANAVNGVINIITKSAAETQGGLLRIGTGNEERALGTVRYGIALGDTGHVRAYVKGFDRDGGHAPAQRDGFDDWRMTRAGFRGDWALDGGASLTVSGDGFSGTTGETLFGARQQTDHSGYNVLARVTMPTAGSASRSLQFYYDRTEFDNVLLGESRDTVDLEYQQTHRIGDDRFVWGTGYRLTADEIDNGLLAVAPRREQDGLASVFGQVELVSRGGTHHTTLGAKVEHNEFSGTELQPSVRYRWAASRSVTLWGAVARAVRTPSRLEADFASPITGSRDLHAENLVAHEVGVRWFTRGQAIDATVFWNAYDDLVTLEGTTLGNRMHGNTYGLEAVMSWQIDDFWQVDLSAATLQMDLELDPDSTGPTDPRRIEGESPGFQSTLRNAFDLTPNWRLDVLFRHSDALPALGVPEYTALDTVVHWQRADHWALSIAGRNLLDDRHLEQGGASATAVQRELAVRLRLSF